MRSLLVAFSTVLLLFVSNSVTAQCDDKLISDVADGLDKYNYLKDYKVWLPKTKKNKLPATVSYNLILNKGKKYRFLINQADALPGKLKFEMYAEGKGMVLTNFDGLSAMYYGGVEFQCQATSMYTITISFSEGEEGCGVVIVGFEDPKKGKYDNYYAN